MENLGIGMFVLPASGRWQGHGSCGTREGGEKRVDRNRRGGVVQSSDSVSAER